jgi:transcriptional regulator with XRE-family HTH domain
MKKVTINYAKSWLMGIDPVATGRQLKKLRRENGFTQECLSEQFERCGDSASRVIISMWESGKKLPSLSHMVFLAELYGCSLDELVISYRRSRETEEDDQLVPLIITYFYVIEEYLHLQMLFFIFVNW